MDIIELEKKCRDFEEQLLRMQMAVYAVAREFVGSNPELFKVVRCRNTDGTGPSCDMLQMPDGFSDCYFWSGRFWSEFATNPPRPDGLPVLVEDLRVGDYERLARTTFLETLKRKEKTKQ